MADLRAFACIQPYPSLVMGPEYLLVLNHLRGACCFYLVYILALGGA